MNPYRAAGRTGGEEEREADRDLEGVPGLVRRRRGGDAHIAVRYRAKPRTPWAALSEQQIARPTDAEQRAPLTIDNVAMALVNAGATELTAILDRTPTFPSRARVVRRNGGGLP